MPHQAIKVRDDAVAGAARNFEAAERERAAMVASTLASFVARQGEFYSVQARSLGVLNQVIVVIFCGIIPFFLPPSLLPQPDSVLVVLVLVLVVAVVSVMVWAVVLGLVMEVVVVEVVGLEGGVILVVEEEER